MFLNDFFCSYSPSSAKIQISIKQRATWKETLQNQEILTGHLSLVCLLDRFVDLIEQLLVVVLLVLPVVFLQARFFAIFQHDAAFDTVVEHELVDNILHLELAISP